MRTEFRRMLATQPTATIVSPGEETVVAGRLGTTEVTVATDVACWCDDRVSRDVVYDEGGRVLIDADVLVAPETTASIEIGYRLDLTDGRSYEIRGGAMQATSTDGIHHATYPARRVP